MKVKYYVTFFQCENKKELTGAILSWYSDNAYSLIGCSTMADAIATYSKEVAFFQQHGWSVNFAAIG